MSYFKSNPPFHRAEFTAELMNVGSQGRTSTLEGGATTTPDVCVSASVCVLDQHTCNVVTKVKRFRVGKVKLSSVERDGTQTL